MKKIIKIDVASATGCGKSSTVHLLRGLLESLGLNVIVTGNTYKEQTPAQLDVICHNLFNSNNLEVLKNFAVVIEEHQSNRQPADNIPHLIYLINSTREKSKFANAILFTSLETDPTKALLDAVTTKELYSATIAVQKTAYHGFYYIHKSRYTEKCNKLVSESDLEEILLTTLSEMNKPLYYE